MKGLYFFVQVRVSTELFMRLINMQVATLTSLILDLLPIHYLYI